ncbi:cleft lip and palate transmembrane protein 1-domain-containing protein [Gorgonomyces haynaldii]|nr:cleft lip and palate transmembrane protein 1-domain-containing protein [Gorgonomyces haynaldii]
MGVSTDLYVYFSEEDRLKSIDKSNLVWSEHNITFGNFSDTRTKHLEFPCSPKVQHNGSLYMHAFLVPQGQQPALSPKVLQETVYHRKLLTRYMPKKKVKKLKKLIQKDEQEQEEEIVPEERPIVSYWWPNVTLELVASHDPIPRNLPPTMMKEIRLSEDGNRFYPIFATNDFWMLSDNLVAINETVKTLSVALTFSHIALWKHQMYLQFDESFKMQAQTMGSDEREFDQIKSMFMDTNPILLGITMAVSLLHSVFDFLAFKNDVEFWRNRKNMEGLSFRTIVLNVVQQIIIFLYLLDNDTSTMILVSNGIGLLIEIWKINKTVIVNRKPQFPFVEFIDRVKPSKLTKRTRKYDEMAFKYLSYALIPLLLCYTVYSMYYESHKSWYSFIIGTLVGFVYTFGFISLTPQLFINYKLKSVAHMPWKTFMYKALNTFIDDLFAFVIKMPWLHRLACLRDDVVFIVYLYQRWIYPEDKRRRNEFGQVGVETNDTNDDQDTDEELEKLLEEKEEMERKKNE